MTDKLPEVYQRLFPLAEIELGGDVLGVGRTDSSWAEVRTHERRAGHCEGLTETGNRA